MFTRITLILSIIFLLFSLAGCGASNPSASDATDAQDNSTSITDTVPSDYNQVLPSISGGAADLKLDASADGTSQQLEVGQVVSISLESNPSTGYSWQATSSDPAIVVQLGEPEYKEGEESATPMVGAPGTAIFFFQAVEAGTAQIRLDYLRSWETGTTPEKTITITLEVK